MRPTSNHFIALSAVFILSLSLIAIIINFKIYHFPGNNFFPENAPKLAIIILINYLGLVLLFGKNTRASKSGLELIYFFAVMSLIAFATNAIQLTPFPTIDKQIVTIESYLNINLIALMEWTNEHPYFKNLLAIIYDTLPYQMSILPLCIIAAGRFELLKEYYFLMLVTTILGFTFYYFFPTSAPASVLNSPLFLPEQIATGLKFNQIHHHVNPTTNEGGLIALPSFHSIWAILCVYLLTEWTIPFYMLLIMNTLLIVSCVLLGWHYPIDIVGAFILVAVSFYLLKLIKSG